MNVIPPNMHWFPEVADCRAVVDRYRLAAGLTTKSVVDVTPVTTGFSGAGVWRVRTPGREFALRRWPNGVDIPRITELHRWLRHLHETVALPVPIPVPSDVDSGATLLEQASACWQLEPWQPGEPLVRPRAESAQVAAVMRSLARLHQASMLYQPTSDGAAWFRVHCGVSPAISERLNLLSDWPPGRIEESRVQLRRLGAPPAVVAGAILSVARRAVPRVASELQGVALLEGRLCPCLRDARPEHFLLVEESVSGIIDAAAARTECVAADLSRLLGGYFPDTPADWNAAINAYESIRPLDDAERRLLTPLDRSNALLSGLHWVTETLSGAVNEQSVRVLDRMRQLTQRLSVMFGHSPPMT